MVLVDGVEQMSADDFEELLKDKAVCLLDVREPAEYASGRIKGAILLPATNFSEEFVKLGRNKSDKIALYCRSGNRSDFVAKKLAENGYKKVFNLEMGLVEWQEWGKPVEVK